MKTTSRLIVEAYKRQYRIHDEIDEMKLEIKEIEHKMSGLAHSGIQLTPEQEKSDKPMPTTVSPDSSDWMLLTLIEEKDEKEKSIDFLIMSLSQAKKVERLQIQDQRMMRELFHTSKTADQVAEEFGYSRKGMYKRIYSQLDKLC